ncbi:class I SAM-dependent methyltransferase [Streptomyces sp. NPDC004065]|uniref:class I SAM-dependent methyltransferase n=1 Tax=Streptomyces sp. NPDC004065 TaxID=3364689 RepID=UPI00384F3980
MAHRQDTASPSESSASSGPVPAPSAPARSAPACASFEELCAEGAAVPTEGWDFSWFEGRASEARPSWGYAVSLAGRLAHARAALDVQTGGGEVLDFALGRAARVPALLAATEGWPPNVAGATERLRPRGVVVVAAPEDAPLPFADGTFDLVSSRHPVRPHWTEIARVLEPGGTYFAQHVGPGSARELVEHFLGPQPEDAHSARHPDRERAAAEAAGLEVSCLRAERLRMEFHDVAAVVHFLRKVIWMVPGFTAEAYEPALRALHERIRTDGPFVAHGTRHLVAARRPA